MAKRKEIELKLSVDDAGVILKHLGAAVCKPGKYGMTHYTESMLVDWTSSGINMVTTDSHALTLYRVDDWRGKVGKVLVGYHRTLAAFKWFKQWHGDDEGAAVIITACGVAFMVNGEIACQVLPAGGGIKFPPYKNLLDGDVGKPSFQFAGKLMAACVGDLGCARLHSAGANEKIHVIDESNSKIRRVVMPLRMD